jgi:hypothetical protein
MVRSPRADSARVRGRGRQGFALPAALLALTVVAVLAAGASALARGATTEARSSHASARALAAAEGAIVGLLAGWQPDWGLPAVAGVQVATAVDGPAGHAATRLVRLDTNRFAVVAEAAVRSGSAGAEREAVRRVTRLARLRRIVPAPAATLTSGGPVVVPADARIDGGDGAPEGWRGCGPAGAPVGTVAVGVAADTLEVAPTAVGAGTLLVTPAARASATYEEFGDESWTTLTRRADVTVDAGGSHAPVPRADGGRCARDASSWGEPWRGAGTIAACASAFPVVHVRGAGRTVLRGPARMQGLLLVDGDLAIEGAVTVAGVVVVRGVVDGPGALALDGALLVAATPGARRSTLGPGSRLRHARCAITMATLAASRPIPLGRRSWVEVTR